jgi:phosphatidylglycerophosphate synthase
MGKRAPVRRTLGQVYGARKAARAKLLDLRAPQEIFWMKWLPDLLTVSRALVALPLLWSAFIFEHRLGPLFLVLYIIGFLTDVFDGRLARKLGTTNPFSAALDSQCDLLFQGSAVVCVCVFRPDVVAFYQWLFYAAVTAQFVQWCIGFLKFRRLTGYHTRWTKVWAVVLFLAIVEVTISPTSIILLPALLLAIISNLEETAITLLLPEYRTDVRSLSVAYSQRLIYQA